MSRWCLSDKTERELGVRSRLYLTLLVASSLSSLSVSAFAAQDQSPAPASPAVSAVAPPPPTARAVRRSRVAPRKAPVAPSEGSVPGPAGALPGEWRQDSISLQADGQTAPGSGGVPAARSSGPGSPGKAISGTHPVQTGQTSNTPGAASPAPVSRIFLPLGDAAGVAGFWSGHDFILVSDHATQMDASALKNTGPFSSASVQPIGDTTLVMFHFDARQPLQLTKQPGGWILSVTDPASVAKHPSHILPQQKDGGVLYPVPHPGRVVSMTDPVSGAHLLIATSVDEMPGPYMPRRHVGYELWPSVQGLVFAAESDQLELRNGDGGAFLDTVGENAVPLETAASGRIADDQTDWSWLGLRDLSPTALREGYRRHWTHATMTAPDSRGPARLAAARSAFALGDPREARAILSVAIQDDPGLALSPDVTFLQGASELLAGNVAGASVLNNPAAGPAGVLWRGLYLKRAGEDPARAAALLAEGYGWLQEYPDVLRKRLQPEVATFVAEHGSEQDRSVLQPLPADPEYDPARAFLALRNNEKDKAQAAFQALARSKDPVASETGTEQLLMLRSAAGKIAPAEAAAQFSRLIPAARLAGREGEVRQAQVHALMQAGQWAEALTAADEEARVLPGRRPEMTNQMQEILLNLAKPTATPGDHTAESVDAIALIESHVDRIPDGPVKGQILAGLGERLRSIGLPARAAIAFERALPLAGTDEERAAWGAELAQVDIEAQRLGQARRALDETADENAGADIASRRRVIAATLLAKEGNRDQALELLSQDETDASLDLRGRFLEEERKWPEAVLVVGRLATRKLPETGPLSDAEQDLTVRLATDAARANDWQTLDRLREWIGRRAMTPERQHIFRLLVTAPEGEAKKRAEAL